MKVLVASLLFLVVASVRASTEKSECGPCDKSRCRPLGDCLAGIQKDRCGCCTVCGLKEGERCVPGECGEDLECRMRTDLPPGDVPEALCSCTKMEPICGNDGQTYANACQLTEARYTRRDGLVALSRGPCRSVPKIVSPPEDVRNTTGRFVALTCEAQGYPVPDMTWKVDRKDGRTPAHLPSDDSHVAVQSRGGPNPYEVTSWLQFLRLVPEDGATYWCVATNELGEDAAAADVTVMDIPNPLKKVIGRNKKGRKEYNSL